MGPFILGVIMWWVVNFTTRPL